MAMTPLSSRIPSHPGQAKQRITPSPPPTSGPLISRAAARHAQRQHLARRSRLGQATEPEGEGEREGEAEARGAPRGGLGRLLP
jgi:hypothetical protein